MFRLSRLSFLTYWLTIISTNAFQFVPRKVIRKTFTSTALNGKLWDKLQVEPDPLDEEAGWYLMNCVVGSEMDLLAQAKHVTKDIPFELIEKLVVPTERKLRSHGKTQKVVEVKVMYPGYVFCKMRICAETYEPLQELPLCRSWMAGTVNQKGYKKLPPAPIALSDEEVAKFKGLEEQTDAMYKKYGEDYTGRGDDGMDLIDQYKGYEVENMVKILNGNFKGEDGIVRRLKDGMIMVRLYTYGNVLDQWFDPKDIRPMTDAEAMKGLTGPSMPVNQDEFDVSIGKRPTNRDLGGRGTRSTLMGSVGGGSGTRMRRQDRINRGERGNRDLYGRTDQEIKEEEENWRQFREEQRASQQQRRGDMWGIKERTSWDSGDDAAQFTEGGWKSGRQLRKENKRQRTGVESVENQSVQDAIDGEDDWDLFASTPKSKETEGDSAEDDFFASLMTELSDSMVDVEDDFMSELSDSLGETAGVNKRNNGNTYNEGNTEQSETTKDDDFFNDLMSHLSETLDDSPENDTDREIGHTFENSKKTKSESLGNQEDDFFNDLMSQLSHDDIVQKDEVKVDDEMDFSDEDFFASLEADLNKSLNHDDGTSSKTNDEKPQNNFYQEKNEASDAAALNESDLSKNTVSSLKEMLREKGLKVSGKKSELISRLLEN